MGFWTGFYVGRNKYLKDIIALIAKKTEYGLKLDKSIASKQNFLNFLTTLCLLKRK